MKEIKFRAWDNVNNEMLYPGEEEEIIFQLHDGYIECTDLRNNNPYDEEFAMLEHLKYMQYTGLKDINGNKVYEGDIVSSQDLFSKERPIYEVAWNEGFGGWGMKSYDLDESFPDGMFPDGYVFSGSLATHFDIEVVGNIYENPELLEGE